LPGWPVFPTEVIFMKRLAPLVLPVLLLAGCATMNVTDSWRDPAWAGPPAHSVVVVGVARSSTTRHVFEDAFSQQLQAAGVSASSSYSQIGDSTESIALGDLVKRSGAEAVLVTRVQRVQQKVNVSGPAYYGGFYGWYGGAWASTPMVTQYDEVTLETSVWDAKSEKLIWSVTTKNIGMSDVAGKTRDLAQTLIPKLKAEGIVR
jgi:hypothetical protein